MKHELEARAVARCPDGLC